MGDSRGHHYLPQLLLKGFASQVKGKKVWVQCYWRTGESKEISVKDIGKETDFHGKPAESDLEAKMAKVETVFAPHVARWRTGNFVSGNDEELAAQFVTHLTVRTKNVREAFVGSARNALEDVIERTERGELDPTKNEQIRQAIIEGMLKDPTMAAFKRRNPRLFEYRVRAVMSEMHRTGVAQQMALTVAAAARRHDFKVEASAAKTHINTLSEDQIPEARVKILRGMEWSVLQPGSQEVILGDVGAIARESSASQLKHPLVVELGAVDLICCPISSHAVLVGRTGAEVEIPSMHELNRASAELSRTFFVAAEKAEYFQQLQKVLGSRSEIFSKDEIKELLKGSPSDV